MKSITRPLALVLIFIVPWEDAVSMGTIGSLARLMGMGVAGLWLVGVLTRGKLRRFQLFHAALALFVLWNIASAFWTCDSTVTETRIKTYLQLMLFVLILWDLLNSEAGLRAGLQAYVLGAWVCVASTVVNYLLRVEIKQYSGGRYSATGVNAVELAVLLALALPLAWYLAATVRGHSLAERAGKILNLAYLPAGVFAIVLGGSRTSLFALVPAALYVLWSLPKLKLTSRLFILLSLLAAVAVLLPYLPETALDRLATVSDSIQSADLGGRVLVWQMAAEKFYEHPLLGIGAGGFASTTVAGTWVHNTFLSILAETGLIGLALFMLVLALIGRRAFSRLGERSILWAAIFLVWLAGALSLSWEFRKATWLFFTFAMIAASLDAVPHRKVGIFAPRQGLQDMRQRGEVSWTTKSAS